MSPVSFAATVPGGGTVCQPIAPPPVDLARAQLLIGTYGRPVPNLTLSFNGPAGTVITGTLPGGGHEGTVVIPVHRVAPAAGAGAGSTGAGPAGAAAAGSGAETASSFCLHAGGHATVVFGGEGSPIGADTELVNGAQRGGRVSLLYLRNGSESWWQLLPSLDRRFGLGKAYVFGDWTLPVLALILLGVWFAAIRLLLRELRREAT